MNKFVRTAAVCIVVLAVTGSGDSAEINSDNKTSVFKNKVNETKFENKLRESTASKKEEQKVTESPEPLKVSLWEQPASNKHKGSSRSSTWMRPTSPFTKWRKPVINRKTLENQQNPRHNVVAVASVSGFDSRNGRVSSINGVQVYPPVKSSMIKTDNKGNIIFNSLDNNMPITITKRGDGVSNTIRIQPGSVSVSSSSSSSDNSGESSAVAGFSPWSNSFMMPPFNDVYFPPFRAFPRIPNSVFGTKMPDDPFDTRLSDKISDMMRIPMTNNRIFPPWFDRIGYEQSQERDNYMTPRWYYPTYNPFMNFW